MKLKTLLPLQALVAAASLTVLAIVAWRAGVPGAALSAAPASPSMASIGSYGACLLLPPASRTGWYRLGLVVAILVFGGGGVLGKCRQLRAVGSALIPFRRRRRARGHQFVGRLEQHRGARMVR